MTALRRSIALGFTLVLLVTAAPAALAGARVTEHYFAPSSDSSRAPSLQIGLGGAGGDLSSGPSVALALEVRGAHDLGFVFRGEFAAFTQHGEAFIFPVAAHSSLGVFSLSARLSDEHGSARSFIEGGIGLGVIHSDLVVGPIRASGNDAQTCLSGGMGLAWQPSPSPVGLFAEARMLSFMTRPRVYVYPVRAGIQLGSSR